VDDPIVSPTVPSLILGLSAWSHDAAAALLVDGQLAATVEQERFSRRKRAMGEPPSDAARWCLDSVGAELEDVDVIALGVDHDLWRRWAQLSPEELATNRHPADPDWLFPPQLFHSRRTLKRPIRQVRHHLAHAASAYFPSGFEDAAIIVADGSGEDASTTLYYARNGHLKELTRFGVDLSLGYYYSRAARYAGLWQSADESGKLMGLAGYGRPGQVLPLSWRNGSPALELPPMVSMTPRRLAEETRQKLTEYFRRHNFPFTEASEEGALAYADFAASVQRSLDEVMIELARLAKRLTGSSNLVLAGGVALNCSTNGKLAESQIFERMFIPPAANDAGTALGAAFVCAAETRSVGFEMVHAYWGPSYSAAACRQALESSGLAYREVSDDQLLAEVVAHLAAGRIVGWFSGRAEIGPRALGARSLLGDPRARRTHVKLNQIKGREMWRPVAPSVLAENFFDYFEGPIPSPFMIVATNVRESMRKAIPAVVHVDGSARPQAVSAHANPKFWALLKRFAETTGIPLLANTSFNIETEPMVLQPAEAVRDFVNSNIDALALENFVVIKENAEGSSLP